MPGPWPRRGSSPNAQQRQESKSQPARAHSWLLWIVGHQAPAQETVNPLELLQLQPVELLKKVHEVVLAEAPVQKHAQEGDVLSQPSGKVMHDHVAVEPAVPPM